MKLKFNFFLKYRFTVLLTFFAFLIGIIPQVNSQEILTGLKQNVQLVKAYKTNAFKNDRSYEAVQLPFIEDFSTYTGYPAPSLFKDNQGFVNSSFPLQPPSIGVVTLDAIDGAGKVYRHASRDVFGADTLTSRPIRLDSLFNPTPRIIRIQDSIYFSFYYQPGGGTYPDNNIFLEWERIGDQPETDDSLVLEFGYETGDTIFMNQFINGDYITDTNYVPGDSIANPFIPGTYYIVETFMDSGTVVQLPMDSIFGPEEIWNRVWSTEGLSLDTWLQENPLQFFKQVLIPIRDPQYLRNNFQFRFRNYASLEDNGVAGWASNVDQWHIDYIQLNINRSVTDSFPNDVAFVMPSQSLLKKYQVMPWSQFQQQELSESFQNRLSNLSNSIKNTNYTYTVLKNGITPIHTYTSNNENATPYYPNGLHIYGGHATPPIPPIEFGLPADLADSVSFTVVHVFREEGAGDSRKQNDTAVLEQNFYNYYAYDDGIAENGYSILSNLQNPEISLAVGFTLNHPDTLRCVRMWFNHVLNEANEVPFTLMVWADDDQKPGNVLYSKAAQLPAHEEDFLDFVTYYLDEPVPVSGTFYVGFYQNHNVQLNIGFDRNNDGRAHFMYKTAATWKDPFLKGVPMIRPVVGKYFTPHNVSIQERQSVDFLVYPNPAGDYVKIKTDADFSAEKINVIIFDMYGKLLLTKEISDQETEIGIRNFASGIYMIRLFQNTKDLGTRKIIKK